TPTQEEIDAATEEIAASSGLGSADELFTALEEQGLSREEAAAQIGEQTALEQLFADEAGESAPSEEDARELYGAAAEQGGAEGELPPFEEVRPQIEAQLQQEHEGAAVQTLLEELRGDADITYHL